MEKAKGKHCVVIAVIIVCAFLMLAVAFWILEENEGLSVKNAFPIRQPPVPTAHPMDSHHAKTYVTNSLMKIMNETNKIFNYTGCYVCTLMPPAHGAGPFYFSMPRMYNESGDKTKNGNLTCFPSRNMTMVLNMTIEGKNFRNETSCEDVDPLLFLNKSSKGMPPEFHVANLHQTHQVCFVSRHRPSDTKRQLGNTSCVHNFLVNNTYEVRHSKTGFFVCGGYGYKWLPSDWSGSCAIADLVSGVYYRPLEAQTYGRTRRAVISEEDSTGQEFFDFLKGVVPTMGPIINSRNIRALSRIMEAQINDTALALSNLSEEVTALRIMALQNRQLLDVLLSSVGGACRMLGASCCTEIPDNTPDVFKGIERMKKRAQYLHQPEGDGWSMMSLIREWGWKLLTGMLILISIVITACCCFQCFPIFLHCCINSCTRLFTTVSYHVQDESNAQNTKANYNMNVLELNRIMHLDGDEIMELYDEQRELSTRGYSKAKGGNFA